MPDTERWTLAEYHAYLARGGGGPHGGAQGVLPHTARFLTLDATAPEDALRSRIQALCKVTGHLWYHAKKSQQSTAGWPDDAIVHPDGGALYLWELKREGQEPSGAQQRWLDALGRATHLETAVYTPRDWETIYTLLTRRP